MKKLSLALVLSIALLPALAVGQSIFSYWAINHAPAATTQATIARAATTGARHVAKHLTVCVTEVAAQPALAFNLRDGATGAGTVVWTASLSAAAGTSQCVAADVDIIGTANTAMTLESAAAPASTNLATVSLNGFDTY